MVDKVDAPLAMVLATWKRSGVEDLRRYEGMWGVVVQDEVCHIEMAVWCTEDLSKDPCWKGKISSPLFEGMHSARVPVELVEELAAHPAVKLLKLARRHRLCRTKTGTGTSR